MLNLYPKIQVHSSKAFGGQMRNAHNVRLKIRIWKSSVAIVKLNFYYSAFNMVHKIYQVINYVDMLPSIDLSFFSTVLWSALCLSYQPKGIKLLPYLSLPEFPLRWKHVVTSHWDKIRANKSRMLLKVCFQKTKETVHWKIEACFYQPSLA